MMEHVSTLLTISLIANSVMAIAFVYLFAAFTKWKKEDKNREAERKRLFEIEQSIVNAKTRLPLIAEQAVMLSYDSSLTDGQRENAVRTICKFTEEISTILSESLEH